MIATARQVAQTAPSRRATTAVGRGHSRRSARRARPRALRGMRTRAAFKSSN